MRRRSATLLELPWVGKQNLSPFDPDALERALEELPDDDEQVEQINRRADLHADPNSSIHARVTGQVLAEGLGASRTGGGGGAAKYALKEAPAARRVRDEAEAAAAAADRDAAARYTREMEVYADKLRQQEELRQATKKTRFVPPPELPPPQAKRLVRSEYLKFDREKYYSDML